MKDQDKTHEKLIAELKELKKAHESEKSFLMSRIREFEQIEKKLIKSESSLKYAQKIAKMGNWEYDFSKQKTTWSENLYYLFGLTPFELEPTYDYFRSRIHQDDLHLLDEGFEIIIKDRKPIDHELRIISPDGSHKWIQNNIVPFFQNDQLVLLKGTNIDITERKQIEVELRQSKDELQEYFENDISANYVVSANGEITDWNNTFRVLFGFKNNAQIEKSNIINLYKNPTDSRRLLKLVIEKGGVENYEVDFITRKGRTISAIINAVGKFNKAGKLLQMRGYIVDITDRKKAEDSLKLFRKLIDQSNDAIEVLDTESGRFIDFNARAHLDLGYSREEFSNMSVFDIDPILSEAIFKERLNELRISDGIMAEGIHLRKDGSTFPVELNLKVYRHDKEYLIAVSRNISKRKKAEEALQNSELQYRDLVERGNIAIGIDDVDGNLIYFNNQFLDLFGYSAEEVKGKTHQMFVHPDDYDRISEIHKKRLSNKKVNSRYEFRGIHKNDSTIFIEIDVSLIFNSKGEFTGTQSYLWDITERKKSERIIDSQLKKMMALYQASIAFSKLSTLKDIGFIILKTLENEINWYRGSIWLSSDSGKGLDLLAHSRMGLDDKQFDEEIKRVKHLFKSPKDGISGWVVSHGKAVRSGNVKQDPRYIEADPKIQSELCVPLKLSGLVIGCINVESTELDFFDENDEKILTIMANQAAIAMENSKLFEKLQRELNERKRSEKLQKTILEIAECSQQSTDLKIFLKTLHHKFNSIINARNFYVALYDESSQTYSFPYFVDEIEIYENEAPEKLEGTLTDRIRRTGKGILVTAEKEQELSKTKKIEVAGPQSHVWLGAPLYNTALNKVIGVIAVQDYHNPEAYTDKDLEIIEIIAYNIGVFIERIQNYNELKKAKDNAEESDRLKSAFLATMSHELRTPLNAIIGFSELISKDINLDEILDFAQTINKSGIHLLTIVEDIFDISLIESGQINLKKSKVMLKELLNEVLEVIKTEQNALAKNNVDINLRLSSNQEDIQIVTDPAKLKQILTNLLKNALKFTDKGHIKYGYSLEKEGKHDLVKFFVSDTGIGIEQNHMELIFDKFRQADDSHTRIYGGTGIGLSISKKLTEILGGKIWVESKLGEGSTFYFTIQSGVIEPKPLSNEVVTETDMDFQAKKVLIVEDDDSSFEFLKMILEMKGINIIRAASGKDAISLCKRETDISIVLMDINMPELNGLEATMEIKKISPKLPIIAQTAYALSGDKEKALKAGFDDYITKPINKNELHRLIDKYS